MTAHGWTDPGDGSSPDPRVGTDARQALRADCARCAALCCVVLPFPRSADFPFDKPAGLPCRNLLPDHRCGVHDRLRPSGFAGCAVFDCFGAGQVVTQDLFGGRDWREDPSTLASMGAVFPVVRQLHEMLWYLAEVRTWASAAVTHAEAAALAEETVALGRSTPDDVAAVDVSALRGRVGALLRRASLLVRTSDDLTGPTTPVSRAVPATPAVPVPAVHAGVDLVGARLAGLDLRRADLRGALLIGADLRRADLGRADLLGADLRGADLRGADLSSALFVTTVQVRAARGDGSTSLPAAVERPGHWSPAGHEVGAGGPPRARRRRRA